MFSNVKVSLYKLNRVDSVRPGATERELVDSGLEGVLTDVRGKDLKMINGVPSMVDKPSTFKLLISRRQIYRVSTEELSDNRENFKDGYSLVVTHYRHPVTKNWITYSATEQQKKSFQITYVDEVSLLGDYISISLKDKGDM